MCQKKYTLDLLRETGNIGNRPISIPIETNHKLSIKDENALDEEKKGKYQRFVGKLIYLTLIRLDIIFAINVVIQLIHVLTYMHIQAAEHILCYLKKNLRKGLLFTKLEELSIEGYFDADRAETIDTRRSTTSYCIF